jgi:antirestriction protein ArdC
VLEHHITYLIATYHEQFHLEQGVRKGLKIPKVVFKSRKPQKDRQHNGQKKNPKRDP